MDDAKLKRKIAVIMAADVVGFSRLVSHDEEGTLRRLMEYRDIFADFIKGAGGRIFNTAGDAVLAEFDSAVEAVRAAMDIQEALKTRNSNLAEDRRMIFRIGVSLGDIVEREGDLLGDGVNIAARLQALAAPGAICISRAIQEQVVNKVSISFRDIGEQSVKNIPHPVHAFMIGGPNVAPTTAPAGTPKPGPQPPSRRVSPAIWAVAGLAALVVAGGAALFLRGRMPAGGEGTQIASQSVSPSAPAAISAPASAPPAPMSTAAPAPAPVQAAGTATVAAVPVAASAKSLAGTPLIPKEIPFIPRPAQEAIERLYMPQPGPKALAIAFATYGMSANAPDEDTAKSLAMSQCEQRALLAKRCVLFAVGNTIVWDRPAPRIASEGPLATRIVKIGSVGPDSVPFVYDDTRHKVLDDYLKITRPKALAVAPGGALDFASGSNSDDVIRRALQICADRARAACLLVAVGDDAVTRVPQLMRPRGLLDIEGSEDLAPALRQKLVAMSAQNAWYALARGAGGTFGLGSSETSEQEAIDVALAACKANGTGVGCAIWAVGPFLVGPKP